MRRGFRRYTLLLLAVPCLLGYVYLTAHGARTLGAPAEGPQVFPPPLILVPHPGVAVPEVRPVLPGGGPFLKPRDFLVGAGDRQMAAAGGQAPPNGQLPASAAVPNSNPCPVVPLHTSFVAQCVLTGNTEFEAVVRAAAGSSCDVILTLGNAGFLDMMTNFLTTSVTRWGLTNALVVALSDGVCGNLPPHIPCFKYPKSFQTSNFGSPEFASLVHVKTEVALSVLQMGYNVLLVDGDIVLLQNPLERFRADAQSFDVQIQVGVCALC